jgi:hypothetical protein
MLVLRLSVSLIEVVHSVRYDGYGKEVPFWRFAACLVYNSPAPRKITKNLVWFCGIAGFLAVFLHLSFSSIASVDPGIGYWLAGNWCFLSVSLFDVHVSFYSFVHPCTTTAAVDWFIVHAHVLLILNSIFVGRWAERRVTSLRFSIDRRPMH